MNRIHEERSVQIGDRTVEVYRERYPAGTVRDGRICLSDWDEMGVRIIVDGDKARNFYSWNPMKPVPENHVRMWFALNGFSTEQIDAAWPSISLTVAELAAIP